MTLDIKRSWLWQQYGPGLGLDPFDRGRYPTMQMALNLLENRFSTGALIVETGCQREPNDIGAGCSTEIFSKYSTCTGGHMVSIDNSAIHISRARKFVKNYPAISFIEGDSAAILRNWSSAQKTAIQPIPEHWQDKHIDLLYLDSWDYPYVELLKLYGYDHDEKESIKQLHSLSNEEIINKHSDIILPCQQHTVNELDAAWHLLDGRSIIMIDDNTLPGGGKPRLAKEWLKDKGWYCLLDFHQTLWIKE